MSAQEHDRSTAHEVAAGMLAEHDECMRGVARVEACLDRHPDDGWLASLRVELARLGRDLAAHFTEEERGPLYRVLPLARPRFADRLARLEAVHGRIAEAIANVAESASSLNEPEPHELREINAEVQLVVAMIRRHESAENEILLSANWDEVGVGD